MDSNKDLKDKSRKGLLWDLLGTVFMQIATLATTVVLARLLTPEEFGVIGIAMVFVSVTQVFIDVGFTDGIIQKKNLENVELSSVFYVNLLICIVLALILFSGSHYISIYFEKPELDFAIKLLSIVPILAGASRVHSSILMRGMDFKSLTYRSIVATTIGGGIGIVLAYMGFGVFALVWQQIASAALGSLMLWYGTKWVPNREFSWISIKGLLSFSSYVFFDRLLKQIFSKIDTLFIGKVFSPQVLGFYSRAESLNAQVSNYTTSSLRKVLFPAFSKLQNDSDKFKDVYFKVYSLAATAGVLSSGLLFFLAEEIILLLLGNQWVQSITIFQVLVFRLLPAPFGPLIGKSLLAKGYSKEKFRVSQIQRLIFLFPLLVGYYYGLMPFTIAIVIANLIGFLLNVYMTYRLFDYSMYKQIKMFVIPSIPLVIVIVAYLYVNISLPGIAWTLIFLGLTTLHLILTKDPGLKIIYSELIRLIKKKI